MSYRSGEVDMTDAGLASLLVDALVGRWLYVADRDIWLKWVGTHWQPDRRKVLLQEALAVAEECEAGLGTIIDDKERGKARKAWLSRLSAASMRASISIAQSDPRIVVLQSNLDASATLLSTPSGTVDLSTGKLRPSDPEDRITMITTAPFDPGAASELWSSFLAEVTCGNDEMLSWLRAAVGMSLLGDQREQVAMFCHGIGANGKTTFFDTVLHAIGDYGAKGAPDLVSLSKFDRHPTELMDLCGRRMVVVDEIKGQTALDESKLKRINGGGKTKGRAMGKDFVEFPNTWSMWLDGNARPPVQGQDEGIWRRLRLVPWRLHVPDAQRDRTLPARLCAEASAVLAWAVQGCSEYLALGRLPVCAAIDDGTKAYRMEQDLIGAWLADVCAVDVWEPKPGAWTPAAQVQASAKAWCEANNVHPWRPQTLGQDLQRRGVESAKRGGMRGWAGLDIATTTQPYEQAHDRPWH